ncbi:MAG: hypothetical protein FVQ81_00330 [Candidatus Glassbacteria bacterium]|nr:hypothetical protein [Candidatus Glassbacteria bacterium]
MPPALDKLEQRIRELTGLIDQLRDENDSFRRAAAELNDQVSSEDALEQIEQLRRENSRQRKLLVTADKRLGSVLEELEKLVDGGKT